MIVFKIFGVRSVKEGICRLIEMFLFQKFILLNIYRGGNKAILL